MPPVLDRVVRAQALCRRAEALCTLARATRATIQVQRQRHPLRRVHCLAWGASDEALHTREYRCPYCGEADNVAPAGHVMASGGLIYADHRCAACDRVFVFVRRGTRFLERPLPPGPPGEA
jgi:hypothetical protein